MLSLNPIVKCGAEEIQFERFIVFRNLHWIAENTDLDRFKPLCNIWRQCPFTPMLNRHWRTWLGGHLSTWLVDVAPFRCLHPRDKFTLSWDWSKKKPGIISPSIIPSKIEPSSLKLRHFVLWRQACCYQ
jgi:hypothetical protein